MSLVLGLDIGIGSCGWAVINCKSWRVIACGSRCFEVPENPKDKKLTNAVRRQMRGQRKVIRRRRHRLGSVRGLLTKYGLSLPGPTLTGTQAGRVWHLRAEALRRRLEPAELASVLIHIAKHRGFKSNSKRDRDNQSESGKLLDAIAAHENKAVLGGYPTFGTMVAQHPDFVARKRNTKDEYGLTPRRQEIEREACAILEAQRRLGNSIVTEEFQEDYRGIAFRQRPLQDSARLVGRCLLEPKERRAAKHCPSFERFRYLSKLATLRVSRAGEMPRPLGEKERQRALGLIGKTKDISYRQLRRAIALDEDERFEGLSRRAKDPESAKLGSFEATLLLEETLGKVHFKNLMNSHADAMDEAMAAIVFYETPETIEGKLTETELAEDDRERLMAALGSFSRFRGAAHISARACRNLLPLLEQGMGYPQACTAAGYRHWKMGGSRLEAVNNPVVRKVLRECVRQIEVVIGTYGEPDEVHLEMARDVGKSIEDRNSIHTANERRHAERERHRKRYEELLSAAPNDDELAAFEMWEEQQQKCLYCDAGISATALTAGDNSVQVDHILPFSRSGDNSFRNKVLAHTRCNQEKGNRTPFEWMEGDPQRWEAFAARIDVHQGLHHQEKRNLKNKTFKQREDVYRDRHLNDTRYAMRVLRVELAARFGKLGDSSSFFAVPGAMTAMCRRAWGVDSLKKGGQLGDRDHALDALVVAAISRGTLIKATRSYQRLEVEGRGRFIPDVETPIEDRAAFRRMLGEAAMSVFVSRSETRRGRGALHDATLYGMRESPEGTVQTERKLVSQLKPADLERLLGDPARHEVVRNTLATWLADAAAAGIKPEKLYKESPPRMPTRDGSPGPAIRSVRLKRKPSKSGLILKRGSGEAHIDLDSMTRVDVFAKNGKFFLVPIYAHQVVNKRDYPEPPMHAVTSGKAEENWTNLDATYEFLYSLYPGSLVEAVTRSGEVHEGYFRSLDRSNGRVSYSRHFDYDSKAQERFKTKTLKSFRKLHVDRLGNRSEVRKEKRVWRGVALS